MFRDITPARFNQLHSEAFQDNAFIETSTAANGGEPSIARWDALSLPGASVLEIGPGAGHLLAAAKKHGRRVAAVESSKVHRAFIRETWGIDEVYADLDELPEGSAFDAIVAINVFEHIYDIENFLRSVRNILVSGGTFFLSTPNAVSLEASVLKTWWSMCKVHDHVSFPSPSGMATVAEASGLQVERIWTGGLPFEFPFAALVSARDRIAASRAPVGIRAAAERDQVARESVGTLGLSGKARIARFYSAAGPFDPTRRLLTALGRAATVKATLIR
jgi:2-polyprenyl-3-methyl-5-hydroxy-6-metoxy-1,4-benzoquinol methylase